MQKSDPINIKSVSELGGDQYAVLYHLSQWLNRAEYQDTLLNDALDLAVEVAGAERGLFVRYEADEDAFHIMAGRSIQGENLQDLSLFSTGILRQVISMGEPCLSHDVQSDPQLSQFASVQIRHIRSVLGVPLSHGGRIWGVILLDSREQRTGFTEENLRFLGFFANLVSLALDRLLRLESLQDENRALRTQIPAIPDLVGTSPAMRKVAGLIQRVAPTDASVLLLGESGTGKDLAARAIHHLSLRKEHTYLAQFCGAIPDTLLESELFGYKKGAFTGAASDKKGLFEIASGGTFFLDEIGDISMPLQTKLLRVLQHQEIMRLGEIQPRKINVRIIAATNQDLNELGRSGRFRQDLYYRLNVFPIQLPPLRERREDIPLLVDLFIKRYALRPLRLEAAAVKKLLAYGWPGNVRQLENVIQRAIIMADDDRLTPEHIVLDDEESSDSLEGSLEEISLRLLQKRLQTFNGNRTLTAESLGVSVRWVQMKLKELTDKSHGARIEG